MIYNSETFCSLTKITYDHIVVDIKPIASLHKLLVIRGVPFPIEVRVNIPFQEGKHEDDYKWLNEKGEALCENIFSAFVERGDIVPTSEVVITEYIPAKLHQQRMHIDIYSSSEKDVWYTTGRKPKSVELADVQKVGELMIPFPKDDTEERAQGSDKQPIANLARKVEVTFDFSHTEIQVRGYDKLSCTEVKAVLDFLSS